jgi:D-amino peptidase
VSKILVSVDMEGISGVATRRETATGWPHGAGKGNDYERARVWMTADANAAIAGAFEGGATEVLLADAHDGMLNLLWDELDTRAELIRGYEGRPAGMIEGFSAGCDAAFFVGYHAPAADRRGVLSHTFTGPNVLWDIRLNGEAASEARFNAALAGEKGVPVALITGDDVICGQTLAWQPSIETAVVKYAIDRYTARCLSQAVATERIRRAASQAVKRLSEMKPYRLEAPIRLEMVWVDSSIAAEVSRIPGVQRCGDRATQFEAADMQTVADVCDIALVLAAGVVRRETV